MLNTQNTQYTESRRNPGFICTESSEFGILKVEDWLRFKASFLE
jgi:hypothetical protein